MPSPKIYNDIYRRRLRSTHREENSDPRNEEVSTNHQRGRGSGSCLLWDSNRYKCKNSSTFGRAKFTRHGHTDKTENVYDVRFSIKTRHCWTWIIVVIYLNVWVQWCHALRSLLKTRHRWACIGNIKINKGMTARILRRSDFPKFNQNTSFNKYESKTSSLPGSKKFTCTGCFRKHATTYNLY